MIKIFDTRYEEYIDSKCVIVIYFKNITINYNVYHK